MPFGFPADGNPGAAVSFGERSRRHGPRARGGAEPGRGPRGGRGRLESRGLGRLGLRAPQGHCPGPSWAPWPAGNPHPRPRARAPSPLPISSLARSPHLRLPPPRRGQVPSPSAWLRSPWNFSEERLLRKEAKGTKTQRGREGASAAGTTGPGPLFAALGPSLPRPHPYPDGSRLFSAPPLPRHDDPTSSRRPRDCCLQPHPHSEGKSQTLVLALKALYRLLWSASQLCLLPSAPITPVVLCFAPAVPHA